MHLSVELRAVLKLEDAIWERKANFIKLKSWVLKTRRVGGLEYEMVRLGIIAQIWWIGFKLYKNPVRSAKVVMRLTTRFKEMIGQSKLVRAFHLDGRYSWDMFNPAWPSPGFNTFFRSHLLEIEPITGKEQTLRRLLIAITKKCPLQCEHCSEAATLNNADVLDYNTFVEIIEPLVQDGVGQLVYSGGEPLNRYQDLLKFIRHFSDRCDQWIYTSAYGLTLEKALELKAAGLNGAAISLDNHLEDGHNTFRRNGKSYYWVMEGIKNLQAAGILVALNVCPTKSYIESGGVEELIQLAHSKHVPIVNLLEPRSVGNYQDQDVELMPEHKERLLSISREYNFNKNRFAYPTVLFPAGYRKSIPCGGGISYMLLDYDGTLYPCPFCKIRMPKEKLTVSLCEAV